jgi:hypothetical protein
MKNAIVMTLFLAVVIVSGIRSADGQITINLPNIKKIVKPDPNSNKIVETNTNTSNTNNVTTGNGSTNWWVDYQIGKINEYKQSLTSWIPANQVFPRPNSSDDYIALALSKSERSKWLQDKKVEPDAKLDAALDEVKNLLHKRLPEYTINPRSFTNRNAAEEKLMLTQMSDIPGIKVFKIGFNQANWLIDKNELGIPKARYKHGLIYGRNPSSEDPFCRVWYVNVVQEYAGGGTYGATEARYIEREFIACPAGQ